MNKKGFTLIELLAVIVILAILMTVSIPAITRYIDSSRKDTYVVDVAQAVNAVRTDALKIGVSSEKVYTLSEINEILDKKLTKSPYGNAYDSSSYIKVLIENDKPKYKVCIADSKGNGIYNSYGVNKESFVSGNPDNNICRAFDIPECSIEISNVSDAEKRLTITALDTNYNGGITSISLKKDSDNSNVEVTTNNNVAVANVTISDSYTATVTNNNNLTNTCTVTVIADERKPVCTWTGPFSNSALTTSVTTVASGTTIYYGLDCTDNAGIENGVIGSEITTSDISILAQIAIVSTTPVTGGYKYTVSAVTGNAVGTAYLQIAANVVQDTSNNGNDAKNSTGIKNRVYLYNAGNEYTALTGGWGGGIVWTSGSVWQKRSTDMYCVAQGQPGNGSNLPNAGYFITTNKINVTSFNKIVFVVNYSYLQGYFGLTNTSSFSGWDLYYLGSEGTGMNYKVGTVSTVGNFTLDVSSVTGSYYIVFATYSPYYTMSELGVSAVYAE